MAAQDGMSSFRDGVLAGVPFILVVSPFAMLFGVVATEAGLNLFDAMAFSIVVIAGAAQFTALHLLQDQAPTIIALVSALMVNLRMAMYSAALTPHLGKLSLWKRLTVAYFLVDQSYACSAMEYERKPDLTLAQKFAYFMGVSLSVCPFWYIGTLVGALVGDVIPIDSGLDFALPIAFIAMIGPALRTRAHIIAALVAIIGALCFAWLPWNLGLLCGALLGMMAGAETERRSTQP